MGYVALGNWREFIGSVDLSVLNQDNRRAFYVAGIAIAIHALRLLEPTERPAKIKGVHSSFPLFIRLAYIWAMVAAILGIWAASVADAGGIWGASRHALTVGFLSTMVFAIGQRVSTGIFRNAPAVQYEIDVPGPPSSYCRMPDAGQLGSSCLSGTAPVSMVVAASFRRDRNECRYTICAELVCHIY